MKRILKYPFHIAGHLVVGGLAGWLGGDEGVVIMLAAFSYQFGSAWRKQDHDGRVDTPGLDCVDYLCGFAIVATIRRLGLL